MKNIFIYISVFTLLLSCNTGKQMNKQVTLWRKDKIPYGTFVAYENMKYLFPGATVTIRREAPNVYEWQVDTLSNLKTAYIILAAKVDPGKAETLELLQMAQAGCHIFISAAEIGRTFLDSLHAEMYMGTSPGMQRMQDSLKTSIYTPYTYDSLSFAYPGYSCGNYFTKIDTSFTTIAGTAKNGKANFIQLRYVRGGSISVQIEPLAFTNFFLLHKKNKIYYDNAFAWLPNKITRVEWDDYYRNKQPAKSNFSSLGFLMKQPSFFFAIVLLLVLCCLAVLAESKRRQRIVPLIPPLQNSSLDFVKTVGRLYFQQRDHKNLAHKMSVHFLDYVRRKYNITTSLLDEAFVDKLSYKSGFNRQALSDIIESIKRIEQASSFSEEELVNLSKKLEQFYKS